jgi:hypothetical protein
MKVLKENVVEVYDMAIVGLGYESRAISVCSSFSNVISAVVAIGYREHSDAYSYLGNLEYYRSIGAEVIQGEDGFVIDSLSKLIKSNWVSKPISCLLDITVMSRTRLATILLFLIRNLVKGSTVKICYEIAEYTEPSLDISPIRKIGPINEFLSGSLGDINLPSSVIIGLGYELGKAIGITNYLDTEMQFALIPKGKDISFEMSVVENNEMLLNSMSKENTFSYDVCNPYKTYFALREIVMAITQISRPIIVPLGPKILSALFVILSDEFEYALPIWRVSSEHTETPVDRVSSGNLVELNIEI